jgi:hypothetical protein
VGYPIGILVLSKWHSMTKRLGKAIQPKLGQPLGPPKSGGCSKGGLCIKVCEKFFSSFSWVGNPGWLLFGGDR